MENEILNKLRSYEDLQDQLINSQKRLISRSDELIAALKEIKRLESQIKYALDAPDDVKAIKTILFDTLNGCNGAENVDEIRAKYGVYGREKILPQFKDLAHINLTSGVDPTEYIRKLRGENK